MKINIIIMIAVLFVVVAFSALSAAGRRVKLNTDKSAFDKDRPVDIGVLETAIGDNDALNYYISDNAGYDIIVSATRSAYDKQAYDKAAAEELSGWLRLSDAETEKTKDGLPAEQLE